MSCVGFGNVLATLAAYRRHYDYGGLAELSFVTKKVVQAHSPSGYESLHSMKPGLLKDLRCCHEREREREREREKKALQLRPPWTASPSQSIALSYHHCEHFPWSPEVLKLHPVQNAQPLLPGSQPTPTQPTQPTPLITSRTHNLSARRNPKGQERGRRELMNIYNNLANTSCSRAQKAASLNFTQMIAEP